MKGKNNSKKLDQFYTHPKVAEKCWEHVQNSLNKYISHFDEKQIQFLEPSAGTGAFYELMPSGSYGFDLEPKCDGVLKQDFLKLNFDSLSGSLATVGNPPFGKKGKLALEFLNYALPNSFFVAFIVPIQFRKWSIQSKVLKKARLISDLLLNESSFIFDEKPYKVRCCFQIWTIHNEFGKDQRISTRPQLSHNDFKMWQYNNTREAEKVFLEKFDFAVPRQGYQDYSLRIKNQEKCERTKQWILFKAKDDIVKNNLSNIDFYKLSKKNTSIPGFGKADVVEEYEKLYGEK